MPRSACAKAACSRFAALPPGDTPPKPEGSAPELHDVALPVNPSQEIALHVGHGGLRSTSISAHLASDAEAPDEGADVRPRALATTRRIRCSRPKPPRSRLQFELPELAPPVEDVALEAMPEPSDVDDDDVRRIGPLEISHGLYSVFLNEADECVRVLAHDINEWRYEPTRPVSAQVVRRAHSLSGISKTVGLAPGDCDRRSAR